LFFAVHKGNANSSARLNVERRQNQHALQQSSRNPMPLSVASGGVSHESVMTYSMHDLVVLVGCREFLQWRYKRSVLRRTPFSGILMRRVMRPVAKKPQIRHSLHCASPRVGTALSGRKLLFCCAMMTTCAPASIIDPRQRPVSTKKMVHLARNFRARQTALREAWLSGKRNGRDSWHRSADSIRLQDAAMAGSCLGYPPN